MRDIYEIHCLHTVQLSRLSRHSGYHSNRQITTTVLCLWQTSYQLLESQFVVRATFRIVWTEHRVVQHLSSCTTRTSRYGTAAMH